LKNPNRKLGRGAKIALAGVALAAVVSTPLMAGAASLGNTPFAVKATNASESKFWGIRPFVKGGSATDPSSTSPTTPPVADPNDPLPRTVSMTIDTRLPGCVADQFNLQIWGGTAGGVQQNAQINWGDGATDEAKDGKTYPHSYSAGTYNLTIDGQLQGLYRNVGDNVASAQNCIKSVDHIGSDSGIFTLKGFLYKAANVTYMAPPPPTVTTLRSLLLDATSFNGKVSDWDVSNVTDFTGTFMNATAFNQPLDNWNMSKATSIADMFYGNSNFNQPLNSWNTSAVTNMSGVFKDAPKFNQPLDRWDTSKVDKGMSIMFEGATSFNQDITGWNVSKVQNFTEMFDGAKAFNQPVGAKWRPIAASQVGSMFADASNFKQDLSSWDFSSIPTSEKRSFAARSAMIAEYLPKGIPVQDGLTGVN